MSTKVSALTQATNAELADASLTYLVIDPSGTPASRKSTLARIGTLPDSYVDQVREIYSSWAAVTNGNYTTGSAFIPARTSQTCTGIRFYWNEAAVRTIKCSLYRYSDGFSLATANVNTSGTAGVFTATFASPVSLSRDTACIAAIYDTAATRYAQGQAPSSIANAYPIGLLTSVLLRDYAVIGQGMYGSGDAKPTSAHIYLYAVEPVISG